jgi:hypothetical protein
MSAPARQRESTSRFVTGSFADARRANDAFERLVESSFDPNEISVVRMDHGGRVLESVPVEHKTGVPIGATAGAALGGTVGVAGAVLAGPVGLLAAGPILLALQGVVLGAAGGGLVGALAGLAFWWDEPGLETELERGAVLLGVNAAGERVEAARRALHDAGATRIFA